MTETVEIKTYSKLLNGFVGNVLAKDRVQNFLESHIGKVVEGGFEGDKAVLPVSIVDKMQTSVSNERIEAQNVAKTDVGIGAKVAAIIDVRLANLVV